MAGAHGLSEMHGVGRSVRQNDGDGDDDEDEEEAMTLTTTATTTMTTTVTTTATVCLLYIRYIGALLDPCYWNATCCTSCLPVSHCAR